MEVKVMVNGLPRIVCGLTKETTCQEVVIVLAQALGQPGRYTLREKFKDFERCLSPSERVLETLGRYGELSRAVQMTLVQAADPDVSRAAGGHHARPPPRRREPGGRLGRGSSSEKQLEDARRPKRKSLSIMEEAWAWLENLGKGKVYRTASEKDVCRKSRTSSEVTLSNSKSRVKNVRSDLDSQTSCCVKRQVKETSGRYSESKLQELTSVVMEDERVRLIENIRSQKCSLEDVEMQIADVDRQIFDLEEQRRVMKEEEEALQRVAEEETEQILFWDNELRAEVGHGKDLLGQFLEIEAKLLELDLSGALHNSETDCAHDVEVEKMVCVQSPRGVEGGPPHALLLPSQGRRPTGPAELRECWTRWSQAQKTQKKVTHRSELTIYLCSTKV